MPLVRSESELVCPRCQLVAPIVDGFALLTELAPRGAWRRRRADELDDYEAFLRQKAARPVYDAYALFEPFNEALRAFSPLVPLIRETLAPGDLIVDLWGRTGFTGELLAGLFPEQKVVSLWEGDAGVLGVRGYRYWLRSGERRANLEVVFASPAQALPFETGAAGLIFGLDTLHRYPFSPLIPECLRVACPTAPIVFPHVHLTNSEPEPYFERGETQLHGTVWRDHFERVCVGSERRAWVLGEDALFLRPGQSLALEDQAETQHHNALVLLGPRKWHGRMLEAAPSSVDNDEARILVNPLLELDLSVGQVSVRAERLGGAVEHILFRHPIYAERLRQADGLQLSALEAACLFWAQRQCSIGELSPRLDHAPATLRAALSALEAREIIQVTCVSKAMQRLFQFYATQRLPPVSDTFGALFAGLVERYGERPVLKIADDDSELSALEVKTLVAALCALFQARGLVASDRVVCIADQHPEYLLTLWALWCLGLEVVPVDPDIGPLAFASVCAQTRPRLVLCDGPRLGLAQRVDAPCLCFDALGAEAFVPLSLGEALEPYLDATEPPRVAFDSELAAVTLFTSGSTGTPKGVRLSQGSLLRTSRLLCETYAIDGGDTLLSLGGFQAMSGLRNPAVAALVAGATIVLASEPTRRQPLAVAELVARYRVSVLCAVPAFLTLLSRERGRLTGRPLRSTRLILTTGAPLAAQLAAQLEAEHDLRVRNYYGLTETGGICAAVRLEDASRDGNIGQPLGAVLQVLDEQGQPCRAGEIGELRVLSDNLMLGYLGRSDETRALLSHGWLLTGDLARRLPDGSVELLGRRDERIKSARGEILHPSLVERELLAVGGVLELAVASFGDARTGQRLAAFVVLEERAGPWAGWVERASAELRERLGSAFVPARFVPLTELPRATNGKIQLTRLRARLEAGAEGSAEKHDVGA